MSTIEDFENAPVGATATSKMTGGRVMKTDEDEWSWLVPTETHYDAEEMEIWGYTLDAPPRSLPTRDEIATAVADGWNSATTLNTTAQSIGPSAAADAVLALLKGE